MNIIKPKQVIVCQGIPASGKSTYANEWVLEDPVHRVRINMDSIRNMLGKYLVPERESLVLAIQEQAIIEALERDKNRENSVGEQVIRNFYNKYKDIYPLNGN